MDDSTSCRQEGLGSSPNVTSRFVSIRINSPLVGRWQNDPYVRPNVTLEEVNKRIGSR